MLGNDGYLKHSIDRATIEILIKCFKDDGLIKYLTHDYKTIHLIDAVEFFANAKLKGEEI